MFLEVSLLKKTKYVYFFNEGNAKMKELLGGKGANLCEMTKIGLPVPPGFVITTEVCKYYLNNKKKYPKGLEKDIEKNLKKMESKTKRKFGDEKNPLLVSVRSGAPVSMPGMMDTILNLGLNDKTVIGLSRETKNSRFAWDSYRRFIQMFGNVVLGIEHKKFEEIISKIKKSKGVEKDIDLETPDLQKIVEEYKKLIKKERKKEFPQNPKEQLKMAINAVFDSWNNPRAIVYRRINNIPAHYGTAVNIQAMVFGNMGNTSGTGVAFTRNPSTGENKFYGEYLINAQGEDVVAGIRTPKPISELKKDLPKVAKQLEQVRKKLEKHYKDMQDFEFTIEKGKLYMLQTRTGKRTAQAAVKIAIDMVKEKLISKEEAILRVSPQSLDQLLHPMLDPLAKQKAELIAKGLPASPGAAVGKAVFSSEKAEEMNKKGEKCILVRLETSPEDIEGMNLAEGILTGRGGMTSHAAVVARGMGKCCVAGAEDLNINEMAKYFTAPSKSGTIMIKEGDWITIDGATGEIYKGKLPVKEPEIGGYFAKIMEWSKQIKALRVRTNADTPTDAQRARKFGAEGIGLCRTEHMFFEGERIKAMREMILSETIEERERALAKIEPYQKEDFVGLFKEMKGLPVTIRLLDPPLHEFLPKEEAEIQALAKEMGISTKKIREKIESLHEFNPMLGFRGVRLSLTYPEIAKMQTRAIIEAAIEVAKKTKTKIIPEIMIPLISHYREVEELKKTIDKTAAETIKRKKAKLKYKVGVMMELPRACLTADKIAEYAEFFSFGTNDLTQTTFGFSRDDSGKFIKKYLENEILEDDPFQVLDRDGVGELIKISKEKGTKTRKNLKIGICGEQGGEPKSVEFCHKVGLNYVSCSPYRVPIAILAAAQAAIKNKKKRK